MIILAIETSCDETAIAILSAMGNHHAQFSVLSNIVLSQAPLHTQWGGVVPNIAKREHQQALTPLLLEALKKSRLAPAPRTAYTAQQHRAQKRINEILKREPELLDAFAQYITPLKAPQIDIIAVTQGPGLEPALWVGVNFARALSCLWNIPLLGVNHMEGHIVSALLEKNGRISNFSARGESAFGGQFPISKQIPKNNHTSYNLVSISYPAIALLVSGGHTELVLIKKPLRYKIIGETRDDAAGEAFDKAARIVGLPYPGGPAIAAEAMRYKPKNAYDVPYKISLPRPMLCSKEMDFSFSGLKTALLYKVKDLKHHGADIQKLRPQICTEFQDAVVEVLVSKTLRAVKQYKAKSILLGGGVAANTQLRTALKKNIQKEFQNARFFMPDTTLTGDNALIIAVAATCHANEAKTAAWKTLKPNANMRL